MEAIIDLFLGLERMAPGSWETTARAFQIASQGREIQTVVEFGCGSGVSTIPLARRSGARITAVDNSGPFLEQLRQKIDQAELGQQVTVLDQSMDAAWPEGAQFDLIWCEGAAYAMGVENALRQWRELLPPGGRIALSDLVWIVPNPDAEIQAYWQNQGATLCYPDDRRALFASQGYQIVDDFIFSDGDWRNYYEPLKKRLLEWESAYCDPENAGMVAQMFQEEMSMYDQFGAQYGYAFFIAERIC
ncbi:class I SAM-dependent methyltransferase [Bremerella sp. JC770]|uniref:SAM-dependent methyltransferase n=1 Tax=Bremerella sp. JC770 TaxID=3232137 RepID=UPI003459C52D